MAASLAGLSQIKKGFCFDAAGDSDFALGWPHVRRVTDESVEYHRVAAQRLMDADFDLAIHWPRDVAAALVHAWGGGQLFELTPGNRAFRLSALEAFWNSETPDREQVEAYIGERLGRAPLWSSKRATESFVLMLEALTSTEWVAEAIVGHLEGMSLSQLHESATQPAWITFQLGYLLLRLPEAKAEALRVRMRKGDHRAGRDLSRVDPARAGPTQPRAFPRLGARRGRSRRPEHRQGSALVHPRGGRPEDGEDAGVVAQGRRKPRRAPGLDRRR